MSEVGMRPPTWPNLSKDSATLNSILDYSRFVHIYVHTHTHTHTHITLNPKP